MKEREPRGWAIVEHLLIGIGVFGMILGGVTMAVALWRLVMEP